jgi:uncharacterized membrane protein YdjX (TVP38/TMEM64 family)
MKHTPTVKNGVRRSLTIAKFTILILIVIGIPLLILLRYPEVIDQFRSFDAVNEMLMRYKTQSIFIYIGLQIVQIILCFLPGQIIQMAAGYAFGVPLAFLLSIVGIGLGTCLTFLLARVFGHDMVLLVFGEEKAGNFIKIMNSKRAFVIVFLLYLFPGIPKDIFGYVAGVSELRLLPFVLLSLIARTPALIASLIFGDMFNNHNYKGMIVVAAIVTVVVIFCLIFRKQFMNFVDRAYTRSRKSSRKSPEG